MHVNSYDEALALAQRGVRPHGAAHATNSGEGVRGGADGRSAGAVPIYVESLTAAIEREVRSYLERIDSLGGMVAAIERGWVQREIEDAAYRHQQAVDSGEAVLVGVNRFAGAGGETLAPPVWTVDETTRTGAD